MLTHWNDFDRQFDTLVRSVFNNDVALPKQRFAEAKYLAPADVLETETAFVVKVDLPGHDPKSIDVKVEKDTLTLTSERKAEGLNEKDSYLRTERTHGVFTRSFSLPKNVDASRIEASFDNGVLTVLIPKKEEEKPRTISIKVS